MTKHAIPLILVFSGKPGDDVAPGTFNSVLKQVSLKQRAVMRYAIVIEYVEIAA